MLSNGQWQRDGRPESYDDGDWVYLGDGVWEDTYMASLPADTRREVLHRYTDTLTEAVNAHAEARPNNGNRIGTADTGSATEPSAPPVGARRVRLAAAVPAGDVVIRVCTLAGCSVGAGQHLLHLA